MWMGNKVMWAVLGLGLGLRENLCKDCLIGVVKRGQPVWSTMTRGVRHGDRVYMPVRVHHRDNDGDSTVIDRKFERGVDEQEITVGGDKLPCKRHHYGEPVYPTTPVRLYHVLHVCGQVLPPGHLLETFYIGTSGRH